MRGVVLFHFVYKIFVMDSWSVVELIQNSKIGSDISPTPEGASEDGVECIDNQTSYVCHPSSRQVGV